MLNPLRAADATPLAALFAADNERVSAIVVADRARLTAIFSDDLRYAHSTGAVDDKASYIDSLVSGRTKYVTYDYQERKFTFPAPGIALMAKGGAGRESHHGGNIFKEATQYDAIHWNGPNRFAALHGMSPLWF